MKTVIFFVLIFTSIAFSASSVFSKTDREVMNLTFNGQWEKADSLISLGIKADPDHPKNYLLLAHAQFYARIFSRGFFTRDSTIKVVKKSALKTIELAEKMEQNTNVKFYLGSAYGLLSRVQIMNREYWNAYWSAWDTESYMEDVLEEDPGFADAWLPLAIVEYYPDVVFTGFYGGLVWLTGMGGDREAGLMHMKNTARDGDLYQNEAKLILGAIHSFVFFENDQEIAFEYFTELREKFPGNPFVIGQYNNNYFINLVNSKGISFLETEFDSLGSKYNVTNPGLLNFLGYSYMNSNRFDDAVIIFKTNIKLFPDVANGYDSMGECYMNREEFDLAIKYYKMAYEKLDHDSTINDVFRERLKQGIEERLEAMGAELPS